MIEKADYNSFDSQVLSRTGEVIAFFYSPTCPHCRRFSPFIEEVGGKSTLPFVFVDISDYSDPVWDRYDIDVVPTVIHFNNGKVVNRISGRLGGKYLSDFLAGVPGA